jgi:nucleoside-diphosphate-sugar epimerase
LKVVVTGGTGFIGSRLALRCLERGDEVRVLGQENTPAERANCRLIADKGAQVVLGSIQDTERFGDLLRDADLVFHLAAAQHEANVPDQYFRDVNVEGTRALLEACLVAGVKRVVHGSTIGVYGSLEGTIDEDSPLHPDNIYGVTKLEGERLALSYSDRLAVVAIRISETYGPGDRRLLKLFRAIAKNVFFVIGNGRNLHHLIYVDDLIEGMFAAARSLDGVGEVFVLAGKAPVTTDEMVTTVAKVLGCRPPRFRAPLWPFMAAAVVMEAVLRPLGIQPPLHRRRMDFFRKSFVFRPDKSRRLLGFEPQVDFAEGARRTAQWYREQGLL